MKKLISAAVSLALAVLSLVPAFGQGVGQLGSGQMLANATANPSRGNPTNLTAYLDFVFASTRGGILERGASGWGSVPPSSTSGLPWVSNGTGADPAYQLLGAVGGGTGNAFFSVSGPATSIKTYTFPNVNSTMAALATIQTWTAAQSFTDGDLVLLGSSSGSVTLHAPATGGVSATFFPGADTVAGLAATQTLTNKTFNCANNTCTVRIASDVTGLGTGVATALGTNVGSAGAFVVNGGALGMPSSGTLTNATGLPTTGLTGTLQAAQEPAHTGDVTNSAGSLAMTIAANAVTNAKMATMNAWTIKMNNTSGSATPTDTTIDGLTLKASPASSDEIPIWDASGTAMKKATVSSIASAGSVASFDTLTGAITFLTEPQGRLTLQANTPVMITSQSAQTTLRYDAYIGNQVPYYTGSADAFDTIASNEVADAMVSAASAGQVVASNVYDVWWVHGGANRICLAMSASTGGGGGWSSDTGGSNVARGTGYTQLDRVTRPYTTNKNSITNCFNGATNYGPVSANQGTYLGTVWASANGQISYTFGAAASGGTAGLFGVWNMYNRVVVNSTVQDSGALYTYTSSTIREARGSAGNQIAFVSGLAEDGPLASYSFEGFGAAVTQPTQVSGIGLDSTTTYVSMPYKNTSPVNNQSSFSGTVAPMIAPQIGFHTISANENSDGTNANTFDGTSLNMLAFSLRM